MLNTTGKKRSTADNFHLAALLSLAAGSVNAAGFFAFDVLTSNVTGHVAILANDIVARDYLQIELKLIWILCFLAGAFVCTLLMELVEQKNPLFSHTLPILVEIAILSTLSMYGEDIFYENYSKTKLKLLAGSALFAMGLQNAMVTKVSGAVVRTTHLTGLFTDLGINLAHALMHPKRVETQQLDVRIFLQLVIIFSFLGGAVLGAYLFANYLYAAFYVPLFVLWGALFSDLIQIRHKLRIVKLWKYGRRSKRLKKLRNTKKTS